MIDSSFGIKHKVCTFNNDTFCFLPYIWRHGPNHCKHKITHNGFSATHKATSTLPWINQLCVCVRLHTFSHLVDFQRCHVTNPKVYPKAHANSKHETPVIGGSYRMDSRKKKDILTCTPGNESISHHIPPWEKEVHFQKCQMRGDMLYT